jgi:hypothetical protein
MQRIAASQIALIRSPSNSREGSDGIDAFSFSHRAAPQPQDFLAEALDSVLSQTFTDYEIIVVSNGESKEVWRQTRRISTERGASFFALKQGNVWNGGGSKWRTQGCGSSCQTP